MDSRLTRCSFQSLLIFASPYEKCFFEKMIQLPIIKLQQKFFVKTKFARFIKALTLPTGSNLNDLMPYGHSILL